MSEPWRNVDVEALVKSSGKCAICGSGVGLRRFTFSIDSVALRAMNNALLCDEHGERLVLRLGFVLGSLDKPIGRVFVEFAANG